MNSLSTTWMLILAVFVWNSMFVETERIEGEIFTNLFLQLFFDF